MPGIGIGLNLWGSASRSAAALFLSKWSSDGQGLVMDFATDQSIKIVDTSTPANNKTISGIVSSGNLVGPGGSLTYTSPSTKLTLQSTGYLARQAHNFWLQSEDFTNGSWSKQNILSTTANQTTAPDGTTTADLIIPDTTSGAHREYQNVTTTTGATYSAVLKVKPNGYTKVAINDAVSGTFGAFSLSGSGSVLDNTGAATASITAVANGFYEISLRYAAGSTTMQPGLYVLPDSYTSGAVTGSWTPDGVSGVYAWGAHYYRYPANTDYIKTTSAAVYALPYEWNTSGECQGVLIEPAATNLCTYSNDLTNSAWLTIYGQGGSDPTTQVTTAKTATGISGVANSATTVTASQNNAWIHQWVSAASAAHTNTVFLKRRTGTGAVTIAIGEKTGSELITNGTFTSDVSGWTNWGGGSIAYSSGTAAVTTDGSFQGAYQAITCTVGKLYAVSADVSVANGRIYVNDAASVSTSNLNTGAIAAGTSVKYYFVATATTMYILLSSASASTTANYDNVSVKEISETTVDLSSGGWVRGTIENKTVQNPIVGIKLATSGDAIDVQYGQIEATSYATSPIETFASTVTRAADNLSIATSAFPLSATVGTLYAQAESFDLSATRTMLGLNDGSSSNLIRLTFTSTPATTLNIFTGASTQADCTISSAAASTFYKVAGTYQANDFISARGGSLSSTDTSGSLSTPSSLGIGSRNSAADPLNGHIKSIAYIPQRTSDANLQSMTT